MMCVSPAKFILKDNPQVIVPCFICHEVVHHTCFPEALASTDYVRMKNEKKCST
jgi:hypothetical protein